MAITTKTAEEKELAAAKRAAAVNQVFAGFDQLPNSACVGAPVVAKLFDVSEATVWRWSRAKKKIPFPSPVKQGGTTRWRVADLRQHIRAAA